MVSLFFWVALCQVAPNLGGVGGSGVVGEMKEGGEYGRVRVYMQSSCSKGAAHRLEETIYLQKIE